MTTDDTDRGVDLPSSFDKWPRDDQLEYLEHTKKKRELIESAFAIVDLYNETGGSTTPSLSKLDWVELFLRLRELHADSEVDSDG